MAEQRQAHHGEPVHVPVFPVIDPGAGHYAIIHVAFGGITPKRITFTRPGESAPWLAAELAGTGFWNHRYHHRDGISRLSISGADLMPDWTFLGGKKMTNAGAASAYTCQYLYADSPQESVLVTILLLPYMSGEADGPS